jgi:hypothetical protein
MPFWRWRGGDARSARSAAEALRNTRGITVPERRSKALTNSDVDCQWAWQAVHGSRTNHAQSRNDDHVSHRDISRLVKRTKTESDKVARAHLIHPGQAERGGENSRWDYFCVASRQNDTQTGERRRELQVAVSTDWRAPLAGHYMRPGATQKEWDELGVLI